MRSFQSIGLVRKVYHHHRNRHRRHRIIVRCAAVILRSASVPQPIRSAKRGCSIQQAAKCLTMVLRVRHTSGIHHSYLVHGRGMLQPTSSVADILERLPDMAPRQVLEGVTGSNRNWALVSAYDFCWIRCYQAPFQGEKADNRGQKIRIAGTTTHGRGMGAGANACGAQIGR